MSFIMACAGLPSSLTVFCGMSETLALAGSTPSCFTASCTAENASGVTERYAPFVRALYDGATQATIATEVTFEDGRKGEEY